MNSAITFQTGLFLFSKKKKKQKKTLAYMQEGYGWQKAYPVHHPKSDPSWDVLQHWLVSWSEQMGK